jgi:hypothetical protein
VFEIRLVRIDPGEWATKLGSLLGTHGLILMMGRLTMLSPVHGATSVIRLLIYLDGEEFQITASLRCALQYLRFFEHYFLWIDATCINQNEATE